MMLGENYADYVLLWLLCHQSRVEADNPNDCWLEKWSQASKERGVRALDHLRRGVELAITALGRGFLSCPSTGNCAIDLRAGSLDPQDYYRQLLRLVYRLLFLFSAEDRGLLLLPGDTHATGPRAVSAATIQPPGFGGWQSAAPARATRICSQRFAW